MNFTETVSILKNDVATCLQAVENEKMLHIQCQKSPNKLASHYLVQAADVMQGPYSLAEKDSGAAKPLRRLVRLHMKLHVAEKIVTLIDSPDKLYTQFGTILKTVSTARDPAKKVAKLERVCTNEALAFTDVVPRRNALLLLNLLKSGARQLISQCSDAEDPIYKRAKVVEDLLERRIDIRRQHVQELTPRYERALQLECKSTVYQVEIDKLLQGASACKKTVLFWKGYSLRHLRSLTACEQLGDEMEKAFGAQVGGLLYLLQSEQKILVKGGRNPNKQEAFSHKLDRYIAVYRDLKARLKESRQKIYAISPDTKLLELVNYASELRFLLSEAAVRIDVLRKHSTKSALNTFYALKKFRKRPKESVDFAKSCASR